MIFDSHDYPICLQYVQEYDSDRSERSHWDPNISQHSAIGAVGPALEKHMKEVQYCGNMWDKMCFFYERFVLNSYSEIKAEPTGFVRKAFIKVFTLCAH